jgi:hypothetical protein
VLQESLKREDTAQRGYSASGRAKRPRPLCAWSLSVPPVGCPSALTALRWTVCGERHGEVDVFRRSPPLAPRAGRPYWRSSRPGLYMPGPGAGGIGSASSRLISAPRLPKRRHGGGPLAASLQYASFVNSLEDSHSGPHYINERAPLRVVCHDQS